MIWIVLLIVCVAFLVTQAKEKKRKLKKDNEKAIITALFK